MTKCTKYKLPGFQPSLFSTKLHTTSLSHHQQHTLGHQAVVMQAKSKAEGLL